MHAVQSVGARAVRAYVTAMTTPTSLAAQRLGLLQGLGAYTIWGLLPLLFLVLKGVSAGEIVADRIIWSLVLVLAIVVLMRRGDALRDALTSARTMALLCLTAALISVNWLTFIWAALNHHVLEASLGYFLAPLCSVLIGLVALKERLSPMQLAAVGLAAAGVAVMASGSAGALWISLLLAASFAIYGYIRKIAPVEAPEGLAIETIVLFPFAMGYAVWLAGQGALVMGGDLPRTALLAMAGVLTAVPLLLFAAAARKLPLSIIGLLQYIAPTAQFGLAITVFGEPLATRTLICFALIWAGLALFVWSSLGGKLAAAARAR